MSDFKCPTCGHRGNIQLDTRSREDRKWRRRQCEQCTAKFTTVEIVDAKRLPTVTIKRITCGAV